MRIQILFRPSPADITGRYEDVLTEFNSVIKKVPPRWEVAKGRNWASLIPMIEDNALLCSIVQHCSAVFNVGSTMAIDFSILSKPSAYFRYNVKLNDSWDIHKVYRFIHFNTMKGLEPVYWINSSSEILCAIKRIINDVDHKVNAAKKWQEVIVNSPLEHAGIRIWNAIRSIARQ